MLLFSSCAEPLHFAQMQNLCTLDLQTSALRPNAEPLHFEQMQNLCTSPKCRTSALWTCRTSALRANAEPLCTSSLEQMQNLCTSSKCRTSALRPNAEPLHFGSAEPLHFEQMQNLCTSSKCRTSALWICRTSALWTHRQWSQSAEPLISSQPISAPRSRERTSAQQASSPSPSASRPVELVQALCAKAMIEFFSCLFLS